MQIERTCYEINVNGQRYDLITTKGCELPEGAEIKIGRTGKILKETYLLYKDEKFPVISLTKKF
jgi:hypothetical protein